MKGWKIPKLANATLQNSTATKFVNKEYKRERTCD